MNLELETRRMGEGDPGGKAELVTNIPLGESTAMRFVAYRDRKGGYIDQVAGSLDVSQSARFRLEGAIRDNGLPVSAVREKVFRPALIFQGSRCLKQMLLLKKM